MNILIVTDGVYPYSMGGSHRLIYEACRVLRAQGHEVTCLVPELSKDTKIRHDGPESALGVEFRIIRFPVGDGGPFRKLASYLRGYRRAVDKLLETERIDVINVHYLPALAALRHLCRRHRIYYTFHGPWAGEYLTILSGRRDRRGVVGKFFSRFLFEPVLYFFASRLEGRFLRRCHRFMVLSLYMKGLLCGTYGVDPARVAIIPSGVNREDFFPQVDATFREGLDLRKSMVFLTVRRLEKRMGLDILIEACALLKRESDDFILLIGGKGNQSDSLGELIRARGLEGNVRMLGFVPEEDLRKYLSLANLFILPSRELEGFGLVVLESMACGTPVLVSPVGGPPEVVSRFNREFVLPSLEPGDIAERLAGLMQSGALGKEHAAQCVEFVRNGFSWEKFANSYLEWLSQG